MAPPRGDIDDLLIDFLDRAFEDSKQAQFEIIWEILTAMSYARLRKQYEK